MPTYEYECTSCGQRVEVVQRFSDAALTTCDACSGQLRKVFSAVGVVFKGSGFYKTDSRSSSSSSPKGDKKDSAVESSSSTGSATDTAPSSATPATPPSTPAPSSAPSTSTASAT